MMQVVKKKKQRNISMSHGKGIEGRKRGSDHSICTIDSWSESDGSLSFENWRVDPPQRKESLLPVLGDKSRTE